MGGLRSSVLLPTTLFSRDPKDQSKETQMRHWLGWEEGNKVILWCPLCEWQMASGGDKTEG